MIQRAGLVFFLFFASGASGLVYEVVWVRQFGILFGSTVHSAALVTGLYMLGLGVGGYLAGRWADRVYARDPIAPLRWYGGFELAIAAGAALSFALIPALSQLSAWAASYVEGPRGWLYLSAWSSAVRYGCAILLLTPITILMGGTLTLLIRFLVADDLAAVGWRIGALYGINTAGAALGCLLTDTALVPLLGLRSTQAVAVSLNLFAGLGAFVLARGARTTPSATGPEAGPEAPLEGGARTLLLIALTVALTGFASMAMQIVWFRHLSSLFGGTRTVFSLLLTVILLGVWLGSLAAGWLERRTRRPVHLLYLSQAGFVVWALATLLLIDRMEVVGEVRRAYLATVGDPTWVRWAAHNGVLLRAIAWVVGPPALLAGAAYPLANSLAQSAREEIGSRAGLLYLGNTLGGVLGALSAGLVLLPAIGSQSTVGVAAACAVASIVTLRIATRDLPIRLPGRLLPMGSFAIALLALGLWGRLPDDELVLMTVPPRKGAEVIALREGVNETIAITRVPDGTLELITNGYNMSATALAGQRYMRPHAHVPFLIADRIERVMLMCYGVGNTARAVLAHEEVQRADVVDLSADVLEHSPYFGPVNGLPLADPRVKVHVNDARQHLRMLPGETYDLVTGEPPPIAYAGVVNLYTREFFELVRSRLRPGGVATYWFPLAQVGEEVAREMVAAFVDVFPGAFLLDGYAHHLIAVGRKDAPIELDPDRVRAALAASPGMRRDLWRVGLASPVELAGSLAATPQRLARATASVEPLSDDRPTLEYGSRLMRADARIPPDLVGVDDLEVWCPRCRSGGLTPDEERLLDGYLEVVSAYYRSDSFLLRGPEPARRMEVDLSETALAATDAYLYPQLLLERLPSAHYQAFQDIWHGQPERAARTLRMLAESNPDDLLVRSHLVELLFDLGHPLDARRELARALEIDPKHAALRRAALRAFPQSAASDLPLP